jgi:hypothetical protein
MSTSTDDDSLPSFDELIQGNAEQRDSLLCWIRQQFSNMKRLQESLDAAQSAHILASGDSENQRLVDDYARRVQLCAQAAHDGLHTGTACLTILGGSPLSRLIPVLVTTEKALKPFLGVNPPYRRLRALEPLLHARGLLARELRDLQELVIAAEVKERREKLEGEGCPHQGQAAIVQGKEDVPDVGDATQAQQPGAQPTIVRVGELRYQIGTHPPVTVTVREDEILQAFIEHPSMSKRQVGATSGLDPDTAVGVLRALTTPAKYDGWFAPAIHLPGGKGRGGYRVSIRPA